MIRLLRFFLRYISKYRWFILFCLLLLAGEVWVATVLPLCMSDIVDRGVLAGNIDIVWSIGIRMALIALGGSLIGFASGAIMSVLSQRVSNDMRKDLFRKIHSLSFGQTDFVSSGTLLTRVMTDTQIITQFGTAFFQMLLRPAFMFATGFAMTIVISGRFAWIFAVAIPLQTVLLILFMRKLTPLFTKIQLKIEKINSRLQETLSNLRLIKAYVRQDEENSSFRGDNTELLGLNLKIQYTLAVMNPLIMLIINWVLIAVLAMGSSLVRSGDTDVGRIIAVIMYIQMIMMSLMTIGQIYQVAARAIVSCDRLAEIHTLSPAVEGTVPLEDPVSSIEVRDVCFSYPAAKEGSLPVLDRISFSVSRGSFFAVVGPTGSGKSTLAALLAGFFRPSSGSVLVNGRSVTEWTPSSVRGKIFMVLQQSALCTGTIADNIRYGLEDVSLDEVKRAAVIARADAFISSLPDGYDTPVSEKGTSLSGGQKQCIAVARALLRKPEVLILDDCTSSMDLLTEAALRRSLREACPGLTLIVIAHRLVSVQDADQMILLNEGRMEATGTHAGLLKKCPIYYEMFLSQQGGSGVME